MLESALNTLLEGRQVPVDRITLQKDDNNVYKRYWSQLQMTLKNMLAVALPTNTKKPLATSQQSTLPSGDLNKLKDLYRLSLKATEFTQLQAIHKLWAS